VKIKDLDLSGIEDEKARVIIGQLLNSIEEISTALLEAQAKIQQLRDEVNLHWPIWLQKLPKTSIWGGRFRLPEVTATF
jgi:hypothetical protein